MPAQIGSAAARKKPLLARYPKLTFGAPKAAAAPAAGSGGTDIASALAKVSASGPTSAQLSGLARGDAAADTSSLVSAYRGEQTAAIGQSQQQARLINAASIAAAKYLTGLNLGGSLNASLRASAADQAGLAAGFSGQLQQTVGDEASTVQRGLDAIGGAGTAPNTSAEAGNVVYGVGGAIPASAMLAAAPYAEAQANAAPGNLVAYGQQQAVGALGAGRDAASAYEPKIAEAIGGAPALERKYLADYTKTAATDRQNTIGNLFKAVGVQQKGEALSDARTKTANQRADALQKNADTRADTAAWRQAQIDAKAADRKATAQYHQATLDAKASQDAALNAYRGGQLSVSQYNAETSRIRTSLDQQRLSQPNASLSRARGILVDGSGNPVLSTKGAPIVLPGNRLTADGRIVKVSTSKAKGQSAGKFSNSDVATLAHDIGTWRSGVTGTANGQPVVDPTSQLNWNQAYTRAVGRLPGTKAGKAKALQLVTAEYGSPISIATRTVTADKAANTGLTDAVRHVLDADAQGALPVPMQYAVAALARVYSVKPVDVRGLLSQLKQFEAQQAASGGG